MELLKDGIFNNIFYNNCICKYVNNFIEKKNGGSNTD